MDLVKYVAIEKWIIVNMYFSLSVSRQRNPMPQFCIPLLCLEAWIDQPPHYLKNDESSTLFDPLRSFATITLENFIFDPRVREGSKLIKYKYADFMTWTLPAVHDEAAFEDGFDKINDTLQSLDMDISDIDGDTFYHRRGWNVRQDRRIHGLLLSWENKELERQCKDPNVPSVVGSPDFYETHFLQPLRSMETQGLMLESIRIVVSHYWQNERNESD
jgi:hypothetical protein